MGPDFGALGERTAPALRGETAAQALQRFFWLCFAKWLALQQLALQVAPLAARPHGEGVLLEVGVSWGLFAVPLLNTAEQLLGFQLGSEPILPMRGSVGRFSAAAVSSREGCDNAQEFFGDLAV